MRKKTKSNSYKIMQLKLSSIKDFYNFCHHNVLDVQVLYIYIYTKILNHYNNFHLN